MTLDDELTRLEQRAVKYGYAVIEQRLRDQMQQYVPIKSDAWVALYHNQCAIPPSMQLTARHVSTIVDDVRRNIARLTAERLTK